MEVIRTEQIWMKHNEVISNLCHLSKNLYNEANYIIRQEFFTNKRWIRYNELDKIMQPSENYKTLPSQNAQQLLTVLDRSWSSFFASVKEYKKSPSKFLGRPRLPKYKPKDGEALLIFNNPNIKVKDGTITLPKKLNNLKIKTRLPSNTNLCEVRIIPKGSNYICEIAYKKLSEEGEINRRWYARRNNKNRIIGIDFGLSNIVTIANNIGEKPIIIKDNGKGIKSTNQFYNKISAKSKSISDRQKLKTTKKQQFLYNKRLRKSNDYIHKLSKFLIDYRLKHNIGKIIFGYNQEWKQQLTLGKINNQCFTLVPYKNIINKTKCKSEEQGIKVVLQEESHTSKCSFLDNEPICHHEVYLGKRIKRGLFRSSNGTLINADVNGALNIIRKSEPNAFKRLEVDGVGGCGLHPIRLSISDIERGNIL